MVNCSYRSFDEPLLVKFIIGKSVKHMTSIDERFNQVRAVFVCFEMVYVRLVGYVEPAIVLYTLLLKEVDATAGTAASVRSSR